MLEDLSTLKTNVVAFYGRVIEPRVGQVLLELNNQLMKVEAEILQLRTTMATKWNGMFCLTFDSL